MADGWCPWAVRLDGPEAKTGYNGVQKTHPKVGVVLHTMEYESTPEWNDATTLYNALFSEREASWTFSICKFMPAGTHEDSAILFQHYPIGAVCWAQGYEGNVWLDAIETEGIAPGKFTEPQFVLLVKTLRWAKEAQGAAVADPWIVGGKGTRLDGPWHGAYLFEHNAVPGAPATDCQVFSHGQVDPQRLLAALKEDDMPENLFVFGRLKVQRGFDRWMSYYPLNQEEKGDAHRQLFEVDAFRDFVLTEINWRLAMIGKKLADA